MKLLLGGAAGPDRFRRDPGRDDGPRRALPDLAEQHRAADHHRAGDEHAGRPRPRANRRRGTSDSLPKRVRPARVPDLWDGRAASRIVDILTSELIHPHQGTVIRWPFGKFSSSLTTSRRPRRAVHFASWDLFAISRSSAGKPVWLLRRSLPWEPTDEGLLARVPAGTVVHHVPYPEGLLWKPLRKFAMLEIWLPLPGRASAARSVSRGRTRC